jgi:spermidine synthase
MSSEPEFTPVTLSESGGVRYLHLGTVWVQGAMRVRQPQFVHLEYVQRMLASLLWLDLDALRGAHAVQLGLGAGAITRFTLKALRLRTTVVELNPMVVDVCRGWFQLPVGAARLEVVQADAGEWLQRAEPGSATLLHVDLYDQEAAAPVLDDEAFYADCRALLADEGVMSVNLFGRDASFERSIARIAKVFGADHVWSLRPTREGNTVVIAAREAVLPDRATLAARAATIEARFGALGLPARKWLRMLRPYTASPPPP